MITQDLYLKYRHCPRRAYYMAHNVDKADPNFNINNRIRDNQALVKEFAKMLFNNIVVISDNQNCNSEKDYEVYAEKTKKQLNDFAPIFNATFIYQDMCCCVDVLVKNKDNSYDIYKIESDRLSMNIASSWTSGHNPILNFQVYILRKCGLNIRFCHYIALNKHYSRKNTIEPFELFIPCLKTENDFKKCDEMEKMLNIIRKNLSNEKEPNLSKIVICSPKTCPFFNYCHRNIPDALKIIQLIGSRKAHSCFSEGIYTLKDLLQKKDLLQQDLWFISAKLKRIDVAAKVQNEPYIDQSGISNYFDKLKYPICYLELKTVSNPIPPIDGAHPYQAIIFQYSLYIQETKNGPKQHKEFLSNSINDEQKLINQLCKDIPAGSTIVFYKNEQYIEMFGETGYLSERYPNLKTRFIEMQQNLMPIYDYVFDEPLYYDKAQNGSFELDAILLSLSPNLQNDIKKLSIVHNDDELSDMFFKMIYMPNSQQKDYIRQAMLDYCDKKTQCYIAILDKLNSLVIKK